MYMKDYSERYTEELSLVLDYISNNILKRYPSTTILPEHFLLAILECENCIAYRVLSRVMFSETINMLKEWYKKYFSTYIENKYDENSNGLDKNLSHIICSIAKKSQTDFINSAQLLSGILDDDEEVRKSFRLLGVSNNEIKTNLSIINQIDDADNNTNNSDTQLSVNTNSKNKEEKTKNTSNIKSIKQIKHQMNDVEKNLINLNQMAAEGKINEVIENDDIINQIFVVLQKKYKNNAILVGKPGVGKTATVKHIANMIVQGTVPDAFKNKKLMLMDFSLLVTNTMFKGSFEEKFNAIINAAKKDGNYIFFIDDIQLILGDKSKFGEIDINGLLDMMLMEKNIQVICTTNNKSYRRYIEENSALKRRLQKIVLKESDYEKTIKILNHIKHGIEIYHNVTFNEGVIEQCTKLCSRYISNNVLPDSAIDILDEAGAATTIIDAENDEISNIKGQLDKIAEEKDRLNGLSYKDYDGYDNIIKEEISLKSQLSIAQKEEELNKKPNKITINVIKNIISKKTEIPLEDITETEKGKLKILESKLKTYIVGQDEAINEVCKVVKKQRLGISNPNKPPVFLFAGPTGTGKTYLAKKLAEEVFGDESYLVRFDMSEYADKMSVNKLYGSANGYVGYENGGQLTEAVKEKKHCVLLLDEIEKADEEVYNVFLQLFDEGRLTDNQGITVDFKNTIIIMSSNIGTKELSENGKHIGFVEVSQDIVNKDIIHKAIKKKFKPEFINRINKIVFFSNLGEPELKQIIKLEFQKLEKRINGIGYKFDNELLSDDVIDKLYKKIDNFDYGARMVARIIEAEVEDKIMGIMLNNEIENGHIFNRKELEV